MPSHHQPRPRRVLRAALQALRRQLRASPAGVANPASAEVVAAVEQRAAQVAAATGEPRLAAMYRELVLDTWQRTLHPQADGCVFVVTGDIPAMWLRDSSAQVRPLLSLAPHCGEVARVLAGVVRMQWRLVARDGYANAFNPGPTGGSWWLLDNAVAERGDPWVWERKYEVDSLALPVDLAWRLWQATGSTAHLDEQVHRAMAGVVALWRTEQHHELASGYRFRRPLSRSSLPRHGLGSPVAPTGMTWQGFRPSDDPCTFGYNIPAQLCAARALRLVAELAGTLWRDAPLAAEALALRSDLLTGVENFGLLDDGTWAYEVDGLGGVLAADDANLPSLLGLPLLADVAADEPRYLATRRRILSPANPWWHAGAVASGIGSPHTPGNRVWPIALAVQGLTSTSREEKLRLARLLAATTGGTGRMHESFDADDDSRFSRAWFSWADMAFCELLDQLAG